ncbi:MAG: MerR family transcriptional regulator [Lachnospiraceae bacterium]|nr:MerR family transcriptional regulator [Lachnospiraceae bacterium]
MDKKMTSGEIAKKAGVSQKAVRLYDEKGLLKPTDYSEGNYRLYDAGALQILEKIVALKKIGFSLEEIRDNLEAGEASNIEEALKIQLDIMENKRYQIQKVIDAINRTLVRKSEGLDWDDVAQIVQNVSMDQAADEHHWDALKHTGQEMDWYVRIFGSLNIKEGEKILDLGCGFAKLWRNNWGDIPKGTKIYGYDIHGSWADNFAGFINDNKNSLPEGVSIDLEFADLENDDSWTKIEAQKDYSLIIAHYLCFEVKNPEKIMAHASTVLSEDGVFSVNGPSVSSWNLYFGEEFRKMGIKTGFTDDLAGAQAIEQDKFVSILEKYFSDITEVVLPNTWHYSEAEEIFDKMKAVYPDQEKFLCSNHDRIVSYYEEQLRDKQEILINIGSTFRHCHKKG